MPSVRAVIGCGKISITNCGWKQNVILLAYITSGSDSRTFVFHCMCRHISSPFLVAHHRHYKAHRKGDPNCVLTDILLSS